MEVPELMQESKLLFVKISRWDANYVIQQSV